MERQGSPRNSRDVQFQPSAKLKQSFVACGVVGVVIFLWGLRAAPQRAWFNLLIDGFFFLSVALASAVFVAILHVSNAGWGTALRRVPEAIMGYLPWGGFILLALYFGAADLYPWASPSMVKQSGVLQHRAGFMNPPFFFLRMAICLAIWILFAWLMVRASRFQDRRADNTFTHRNVAYAAIFLALFAVTFSMASFDWIMSLEEIWSSTIFAVYNFSGLFLVGIAAITLVTLLLKAYGVLAWVNENHLHTLGKLMFAFSTFWAYIWISQYLLIYYANIPEETIYFIRRTSTTGWQVLFFLNLFLNWVVPFLLMMPRSFKRSNRMLGITAAILFVGHWIDLYTMTVPSRQPFVTIGIFEIGIFIGVAGLFAWIVARNLEESCLLPIHDPYLEESLELHV